MTQTAEEQDFEEFAPIDENTPSVFVFITKVPTEDGSQEKVFAIQYNLIGQLDTSDIALLIAGLETAKQKLLKEELGTVFSQEVEHDG